MSRVAVLMGGISGERDVSLSSGHAVVEALTHAGVDAFAIDLGPQPLPQLVGESFDIAFICLHGGYGEDGRIQAMLDLMGIPYTGSGHAASALAMDKQRSKAVFAAHNLPVVGSQLIDSSTDLNALLEGLGGKVMVKPNAEGSSLGNVICDSPDQVQQAMQQASQYGDLMAEQFVDGPEFTCAVIRDRALPVIRIESQSGVYDYAAKYQTGDTAYHIPAGLEDEDESYLQSLALDAVHALGCTGWARVDFMWGNTGPIILEVNTVPGMTATSLVPKAAAAVGLDFPALCLNLLEAANG